MRLAILLLVVTGMCRARIDPGGEVNIFRCCRDGEALAPEGNCNKDNDPWQPVVFYPASAEQLRTGVPAHWRVSEGMRPKCSHVAQVRNLGLSPSFLLLENGSLWSDETSGLAHPGQYCVDKEAALVCVENRNMCRVRKCCGQHAAYSEHDAVCLQAGNLSDHVLGINANIMRIAEGFPACPQHEEHLVILEDPHLKADCSLHLPASHLTLRPGEFCVDHVILEGQEPRAGILVCPEVTPTAKHRGGHHDLRFTLYPAGLFLSAFFLAATLAAGCLLPPSHHLLHWKCQTGHVSCLMFGDILLAITQIAGHSLDNTATCYVFAVLMHFLFLAAFFWLNTMCFNIWWTFRDLRPASLDKGQEMFRLRLYQMYAWGSPLIIAGTAAILDNLPEDSNSSFLRPRFGQQRCWFYGDVEILPYFYGPVGILLLVNMLLFGATARELTCGLWSHEVVKSTTERATLGRVCLKLVVVMGLTWVADVVSWAVGGPDYLWYVTDIINSLQGVFIFIVAGCQPQVWSAINRMWCLRMTQGERSTTNMGQHLSLYSQGPPSLGESISKTGHLETLC